MANITQKELNNFRCITSGGFGTIYEHNGKVYKVYNSHVKTEFGLVENPILKHALISKNKIRRMIRLNDGIMHTDLPEDIIFVDNIFQGIIMPYYEGDTILQHMNDPLLKKISLSRQMVRNARELTDNLIYTFDYKLINTIVNNGEPKFIDLDDVLTKVTTFPNPFYNQRSIYILDETIKAFFRENDYKTCVTNVREFLTKKYDDNDTYDGIESYLISLAIDHTYVLISDETDLSIEMLRDPNYRVILVTDTYSKNYYDNIMEILMNLRANNILVYEIIDKRKLENYLNDIAYKDIVDYRETKKLKLKK